MIEIEKPTITKFIDEDGLYGKFVVEPLERGYGTTPWKRSEKNPSQLTSGRSRYISKNRRNTS